MEKFICENCKTEVLDSYSFCPECGGKFEDLTDAMTIQNKSRHSFF